jgi:hypothetical protein
LAVCQYSVQAFSPHVRPILAQLPPISRSRSHCPDATITSGAALPGRRILRRTMLLIYRGLEVSGDNLKGISQKSKNPRRAVKSISEEAPIFPRTFLHKIFIRDPTRLAGRQSLSGIGRG